MVQQLTKHFELYRNRENKPECVVFASSAKDVSTAFIELKNFPDVKFSVKSGGHDPNLGHSSVKNGVLISLNKMKGATYDSTTKLAKVLPGGEWINPISDLAKHDVTVVGGRLGPVGVGGLISGGGLSFLSAQHGLVCDVSFIISLIRY